MKYSVVQFEYSANRAGNPFMFGVEGEPTTLAEWKATGGKTRQTMTLAEIEAAGIALPDAFAGASAETTKRADALQAEITEVRAAYATIAAKLEAARKALE